MNFLFYLFSSLAILSALGVVLSREGVQSALMMLMCLVSVASLFILLQAYLIAVLQIWVYAGAVMVLFVFMLMLLGKAAWGPSLWVARAQLGISSVLLGSILAGVAYLVRKIAGMAPLAQSDYFNPEGFSVQAKPLAALLFSKYLLPLELVGFLLLGGLVAVLAFTRPSCASNLGPRTSGLNELEPRP